jgi:hypothetical protein
LFGKKENDEFDLDLGDEDFLEPTEADLEDLEGFVDEDDLNLIP